MMRGNRKTLRNAVLLITFAGAFTAIQAQAQTGVVLPKVSLGIGTAQKPQDVAVTLQILLMMTILTLAPSLLIMTTAFTRLACNCWRRSHGGSQTTSGSLRRSRSSPELATR
jgi:flagellar biosynthesis protein FliP